MYPDPITPKAFPDPLQRLDYDPFGLMPGDLPAPPRGHLNASAIRAARNRLAHSPWMPAALDLLKKRCQNGNETADPDPLRNALAFALTDDAGYRDRAWTVLRVRARRYREQPVNPSATWAQETIETAQTALALDLLAAGAPADDDDRTLRAALAARRPVFDLCPHRTCSNHVTHNLSRLLAWASALGDRQAIHDVLYGWSGADGHWRYGLIHQLRHDFFADGPQWERTIGYHYYTLMALTRLLDLAANLGIDLWHRVLPALHRDDGHDIHGEYEDDIVKTVKSIFDAPFYMSAANGDLPLLHDSGLSNLRGVWIWGPLYNLAYEIFEDPKYAWLLNRMEHETPKREHPGLPMPLQTTHGDLDFPRVRDAYPPGEFDLTVPARVAPRARHDHGCTLFPVAGNLVLRAQPGNPAAATVSLFFGPHAAGHQSPAALHADIHLGGRRLTVGPSLPRKNRHYDDPACLTWIRATIAHNTVTVDRTPMLPYDDPDGQSVFEADTWRDSLSDGELTLFQIDDPRFKAARAVNPHVYPGVRLDRTLVAMPGAVLDVFRVRCDRPRLLDWAIHLDGEGDIQLDGAASIAVDPEPQRGYRHLSRIRRYTPFATPATVTLGADRPRLVLASPDPGCELLAAADFPPDPAADLGDLEPNGPRTCLIARIEARETAFIALWTAFTGPITIERTDPDADGGIRLRVDAGDGRPQRWELPLDFDHPVMLSAST